MSGDRHDMGDATWEIVRLVLPHWRWDPERVHDRRVINGIFFVLRTGTPRRDLPERYGPYTICCNRTTTDGTGTAPRRRSWRSSRGLRVMSTGATTGATTVHLGIDANAIVKTVFQTPGQAADCTQAGALLAGLGQGETVAGDRAHDTDAILDFAEKVSATTVFPSRSGRKSPPSLDRETYGTGYLVERFFSKITEFRTVATRYDKSARNFLSAVHLAACRFLRRTIENQLHKSTA